MLGPRHGRVADVGWPQGWHWAQGCTAGTWWQRCLPGAALPCTGLQQPARGLSSHDACTCCVCGHRKLCAGCPGEALPVGTGGCCLSEASSWGLRGAGVLQLGVGTDTQHIRDLEQVLPKGRVSVGNFISSLARWRSEMQEPEKTSYSVHQKVQIRRGPAQLLRDRRSVWWRGSHLIAVL